MRTNIDIKSKTDIMKVEDVANYLQKSTSWVYKNWKAIGGRKLEGSLFFPKKEDLYERLFGKEERVEIRLHSERDQAHRNLVQNKKRSKKSRSRKKKGGAKSSSTGKDPNRYGLLGAVQ